MKRILRSLAALAVIFAATGANAAVLASWDVDGIELDAADASGIDGNSTSSPYTFTGSLGINIQDAKLTLSSAVNRSTSVDQYGFKVSGVSEQTTLSGAITADHYLQFTLVAAGGYELNLTSIEMNGQTSGTGADDVAILSNVDGFSDTAVIDSVTGIAATAGGLDTDVSGFGAPIDLSAGKFQGLSSITFRAYGYNTTDGAGVTYLRGLSGVDLAINGTAEAVPEPASLALISIVGFLGIFRRRR